MGNITIQGDLTGDVPGGEVGGASNLTTVGAIPYVSAAGILNQDPTALFWDAANNYLYAGGYSSPSSYSVRLGGGNSEILIRAGSGSITHSGALMTVGSTGPMAFYPNNSEASRFAASTNNLLIGTSTDSNFKLDVAASGSAGTARFYGGSGVTDKTNLRIQEGGGNIQGDRLLEVVNANNTSVYFNVNPNANVSTSAVGFQTTNQRAAMVNSFGNGGGFILGDIYRLSWSSNASVVSGSYDLSLSRASAGVLQVGDGGANANGQVSARAVNAVSSLAAFNSTGGIYMSGNAGSSWGTIQSYSDGSGTAKATAINPTGGNLLIGTTTDSNFKLDVAASGSAGTARFYGGSGVTASTKVVVQAGGGQGTTNLTEWQNSGGTAVLQVDPFNQLLYAPLNLSAYSGLTSSGIGLGSGNKVYWTSGTSGSAIDLSLSRASAGVLRVGDGGSNANGVVSLTRSQHAGVLVAALPAAAAGNAGSIQYVTDANATTIGSTVAGGGANKVMVWSDGAAWKIFAS